MTWKFAVLFMALAAPTVSVASTPISENDLEYTSEASEIINELQEGSSPVFYYSCFMNDIDGQKIYLIWLFHNNRGSGFILKNKENVVSYLASLSVDESKTRFNLEWVGEFKV